MKTAIISDIHGNLQALQIVFKDISLRKIDRIICLGDLVEGGDYNDEVVELIKENNIITIRGNHDDFNECNLKPENQQWLTTFPEEIREQNIIYTHISPRPKKISIKDNIEAWNVFDEHEFYLCFIGHIHFPILFGAKCEFFAESQIYAVDEGCYFLEKSDRFIVCFGAVGYPRGGGKFIRYGIYNDQENSLEFIKLKGYLLPYGLCTPY